jgi:hypothetical protein
MDCCTPGATVIGLLTGIVDHAPVANIDAVMPVQARLNNEFCPGGEVIAYTTEKDGRSAGESGGTRGEADSVHNVA